MGRVTLPCEEESGRASLRRGPLLIVERLICFGGLEGKSETRIRTHKGLSMEHSCGRAQQTVGLEAGSRRSSRWWRVAWDCVPTLSVPWCFLICKMGP